MVFSKVMLVLEIGRSKPPPPTFFFKELVANLYQHTTDNLMTQSNYRPLSCLVFRPGQDGAGKTPRRTALCPPEMVGPVPKAYMMCVSVSPR